MKTAERKNRIYPKDEDKKYVFPRDKKVFEKNAKADADFYQKHFNR